MAVRLARVHRGGVEHPKTPTSWAASARLHRGLHGAPPSPLAGRPDSGVSVASPVSWSSVVLWTLVGVSVAGAVCVALVSDSASLWDSAVAVQRLGLASAAGIAVTLAQRRASRGKSAGRPLERAQVLAAVAGALTMLLVDNSVARAFGVAGLASVVRFRTPIEDPAEATVLFLAMGIGMSCGIGATTLAICGALFVCGLVMVTAGGSWRIRQALVVDLVSSGSSFDSTLLSSVFARHGMDAELAEWKEHGDTRLRFRVLAPPDRSYEALGRDLARCPGVASVSCELRKSAW